MKQLANSVRSEFIKVFSTRIWWLLALVMFFYIGFTTAMMGGLLTVFSGMSEMPIDDLPIATGIYALAATIGYLFPVLLGALSVTGEYRNGTIASSFIWAGDRGVVLTAKSSVQFVMGVAFGFISLASAVLGSVFFFLYGDIDTALASSATYLLFLRALFAMGIWAVIGVGVGTLVRNQAAAIVTVLVFTQFLEPVLRMVGAFNDLTGKIVGFFPGAASDTFIGQDFNALVGASTAYDQLSWWAGGLVLVGYAVVFLIVGWLIRWRKDVT